mmetsp:Transcript_21874/g.33917  ORF Transcript_21874/g.33917 Transcript_21874/m.33917 type:complete len:114 (+) Transcript_21874:3764-4105(+)
MNNVFCTPVKIDYRYDLKGSTQGRTTDFPDGKRDNTIALKDNNFLQEKRRFQVGRDAKAQLMKIIEKDAAFFARQGILDYSLLLGVHERRQSSAKMVTVPEHASESSQIDDFG